jgi:hypothetical protein
VLWLFQDQFSKQKGFMEEELDYRKQALDQAYMVRHGSMMGQEGYSTAVSCL